MLDFRLSFVCSNYLNGEKVRSSVEDSIIIKPTVLGLVRESVHTKDQAVPISPQIRRPEISDEAILN